MSKIFFFLRRLLLIIFFIFNNTQIAKAVTITPIGDLNIGETKQIIFSGLNLNTKYHFAIAKATSKNIITGNFSYTDILGDCYYPDTSGQIVIDIGPFSLPGYYKLKLYRANNNAQGLCERTGTPVITPDPEFSVGGPTGDRCCSLIHPTYFRSEDVCKLQPFDIPLQYNPSSPTVCSSNGTSCEPESLSCFKNKTPIIGTKICKDPKDKDFDPNKHTICASAKGNQIPGCGDNKDLRGPAIATAIGCIHTNPAEFAKDFLTFVIALGGGLAFLMMLLGAFQMLTSAGNPDTLNAGRERLTSAVIGLLFIIFAVLLLQIIGFDILKLPDFGR